MSTSIFLPESWYVFLRLHHLLIERLDKFYSDCLAHQSNMDPYYCLLSDIKKLLNNEMDNCSFETALFYMHMQSGCAFLTVEKLVANCVRQISAILNDEKWTKSLKLYFDYYDGAWSTRLLNSRNLPDEEEKILEPDEMQYELLARKIFDGHTYFKTTFDHKGRRITFDLISLNASSSFDDDEQKMEESARFAVYVKDYVDNLGINQECFDLLNKHKLHNLPVVWCRKIFLKRNFAKYAIRRDRISQLKINDEANSVFKDFIFRENLLAQLSPEKQKLRYVSGTWDFAFRLKPEINSWRKKQIQKEASRRRAYTFLKWYRIWTAKNLSETHVKATEAFFLNGFTSSQKYIESPTGESGYFAANIEKVTVNCENRPFAYRRNFYVDISSAGQKPIVFRLDID